MPTSTKSEIRSSFRVLVIAIAAMYLFLGVLLGYVWYSYGETHDNFCKFKRNLQGQINTSRKFLAKHPYGVGEITRSDIQLSIDRQQRTVDSLSGLHC